MTIDKSWVEYVRINQQMDRQMEPAVEHFNPQQFHLRYDIFNLSHLGVGRILQLDPKMQLPNGSILHLIDNVLHPNTTLDIPDWKSDPFCVNEDYRRVLYHVKEPNFTGPITTDMPYVFRNANLPTKLLQFRKEAGNAFVYAMTPEACGNYSNHTLMVVNHNPVWRINVRGSLLAYHRKLTLFLTSVLNTCSQFAILYPDRRQFITIPWDSKILRKELFSRALSKLDITTLKYPQSFHYLFMLHMVLYVWNDTAPSIFRKLPDELMRKITFIIRGSNRVIFLNLKELLNFPNRNQTVFRLINQLNFLSLIMRDESDPLIQEIVEKSEIPEIANPSVAARAISLNHVTSNVEILPKISVSTGTTHEDRLENIIDATADKIAETHLETQGEDTVAAEAESPKFEEDDTPPESNIAARKKVPSTRVKARVEQLRSQTRTVTPQMVDTTTSEFNDILDARADQVIDDAPELTPKQKLGLKKLARKYKTLKFDDRTFDEILAENSDIAVTNKTLGANVVGEPIDESLAHSTVSTFDTVYREKVFVKQMLGIIAGFRAQGIYLVDFKKEKYVDQVNNTTTYVCKYVDIHGKSSTVRFKMPNVDRHGRFKIDGIESLILKQRVNNPIVKISDTQVSLYSNYNKARVIRNDAVAHSFFAYINRIVNTKKSSATIRYGNCVINEPVSYEYASLSERYTFIKFQDELKERWDLFFAYYQRLEHFGGNEELLKSLEAKYGVYCGRTSKNYLFIDVTNTVRATTFDGSEVVDFPYSSLTDICLLSLLPGNTKPKPLTEWVTFRNLDINLPVIFVMAYRFGLRKVLDMLNAKYTITERRTRVIVGENDRVPGMENMSAYGIKVKPSDYYYHLTSKDLGTTKKLTPSLSEWWGNGDAENASNSRICVSDNIFGCIAAITSKIEAAGEMRKTSTPRFYVYAVHKSQLKPNDYIAHEELVKNEAVYDAEVTNEAWILTPTFFTKLGIIEIDLTYHVQISYTLARFREVVSHNLYDRITSNKLYGYNWIMGEDPTYPGITQFKVYEYVDQYRHLPNVAIKPQKVSTLAKIGNTIGSMFKMESTYGFYYKLTTTDFTRDHFFLPDCEHDTYFVVYPTLRDAVNAVEPGEYFVYTTQRVWVDKSYLDTGDSLNLPSREAHIRKPTNMYYCGKIKITKTGVIWKDKYDTGDTRGAIVDVGMEDYESYLSGTEADDGIKYKPKPQDIRITFADRELWFNRYPLEHSLILAGLDGMDLTGYELSSFEDKEVYYQILMDMGKSINYLKGIDSFFDLFIDPITYNVLREMDEPTTPEGLLIRSAQLLSTKDYRPAASSYNYRIRGYEQFNAILYNEMARACHAWQVNKSRSNSFTVNPNAVYLKIVTNSAVQSTDLANPIQDIKLSAALTFAGTGGRDAESFVIEDRRFVADDIGIMAMDTSDNQKVGMNSQLPVNAQIQNTNGALRITDGDGLNPADAFSLTSLLFPFSTHDDNKRLNFIGIQMGHMIPTTYLDKSRVRTGYERVIAQYCGRKFSGVAAKDGKVTKIDAAAKTIEVTYNDGTVDVFAYGEDYTEHESVCITTNLVCNVSERQTVKAGDIICYDKSFFTQDPITNQVDFSIGVTANTVLMETDVDLEDACAMSKRLSEKLTIVPTNTRVISLPCNSIIHKCVKVGDTVAHTDNLLIFEEDYSINGSTELDNFKGDEDTLNLLGELNRKTPESKYAGEIVRIDALYGCHPGDMHPSLQKVVREALSQTIRRARNASDTSAADDFPMPKPIPVGTKVKGVTFDDKTVMLVFYIQEKQSTQVGDKCVLGLQLKHTVSSIMQCPQYTGDGEEIDVIFSADAVGRRIVLSATFLGITNRIMEKLENNIVNMYFK